MQYDAKTMFADALAYGGTPTAVDLKTTKAGPGKPLQIHVQGHSLAGITGVKVDHGATSSPTTDLLEVDISSTLLNTEGLTLTLPDTVLRYVVVSLVGTGSAGTWTSGITLSAGQSSY